MKNNDQKNTKINKPKLLSKIPSKIIEAISSIDLEVLYKNESCYPASIDSLKIENKLNPELKTQKDNFYIIGNYLIKRTLGEGTFGKVKLGIYLQNNKKVAIKIYEKEKIKEEDEEIRVKREFEMLAKFNHPNVISVGEIFESILNYYIVMEYCEKGELFNYILKKRRLSSNESAFFYYQLINGLEYIHSLGIVHRDLKPENLLLTKNNVLKIIDFGLSNYFKKYQRKLLVTPCGSPCYASPEMVSGKKYNGFKIDIWSSGIILYVMLCGYLPFEDKNNEKLFKKILECKLEFPKYINDDEKDLIKKILVTDPYLRIDIPEIKKHSFFLKGKKIYEKKFMLSDVKKEEIDMGKNTSEEIKNGDINIKSLKLCVDAKRKKVFEELFDNEYLSIDNDENKNKCEMVKESLDNLNNDNFLIINKKNDNCQIKVAHGYKGKKNEKNHSIEKKKLSFKINPKLDKLKNTKLINIDITQEKNKDLNFIKKNTKKNKINNIFNHYITYNFKDKNLSYNYGNLVKNRLLNYKKIIKDKLKNKSILYSDKKNCDTNNNNNLKLKKININNSNKNSKQLTKRENYSYSKKSNSISMDKHEKNYYLNLFNHNTCIKEIKIQKEKSSSRKKPLIGIEVNCDNNYIFNTKKKRISRTRTETKNNKRELFRDLNKIKRNIMVIKLTNNIKMENNLNMNIIVNYKENINKNKRKKINSMSLKSDSKRYNTDSIYINKNITIKDISANKSNDKYKIIKSNNSHNKNLNIDEEIKNSISITHLKTEQPQTNKKMKNNKSNYKNHIFKNKIHSHTISEQYSKASKLLNNSSYIPNNHKFKNPFFYQNPNTMINHKNKKKIINLKNFNRPSPDTRKLYTTIKNNKFNKNSFDLFLDSINKNDRSSTVEENKYGKHRLSYLCNEYQISYNNYCNTGNLLSMKMNNKHLNSNNNLDMIENKGIYFHNKKVRKINNNAGITKEKNSVVVSKLRQKQLITNTNATNKQKKNNKLNLNEKNFIKCNNSKIDEFSLFELKKIK